MQKKHCIIILICILCLLTAGAAGLFISRLSGRQSPVLAKAAEGLNEYRITLKLDDQAHTLSVTEEVQFTNRTKDTLSHLVLRLWPNAYATEDISPAATEELFSACYPDGFSAGSVLLHDVKWNDVPAAWQLTDAQNTVLSVTIPSLAPGESGKLFLRCVVQLPNTAHRTGYAGNVYQLNHVIPLLSVYENGAWRQDPYTPIGEPFYTDCANFELSLSLPEGYTAACSLPLKKESSGQIKGRGQALRDVGLCVSREYKVAKARVGSTDVYAYAKEKAAARQALQYAKKALSTYEKLYGDYPYPVYSVCSASFAPGAMEYPCMAVVDQRYFAPGQQETLELFIAHETAHQWFYHLVGSDPVNQPWQDEALCEYALLRYVDRQYGRAAFENLAYYRAHAPMQERIPGGLTPASPTDYFSSLADYKTIVYGRGAAMLLALDLLAPGSMDDFLKEYVGQFSFRNASRSQFETALSAWAKMDVSPLVQDYLDTKINE